MFTVGLAGKYEEEIERHFPWADPRALLLAIISCEGGFDDPKKCNYEYGCGGGQSPCQMIPRTWDGTIIRMSKEGVISPECANSGAKIDMECHLKVCAYLLAKDGVGHWDTWSGSCWRKKLGL